MPNGIVNGIIHFLGQDNQHEVQHDFFGHVMLITSLATPLHSLDQDDQSDMQCDFLSACDTMETGMGIT